MEQKSNKKKIIIGILLAVVLLILSFFAYVFVKGNKVKTAIRNADVVAVEEQYSQVKPFAGLFKNSFANEVKDLVSNNPYSCPSDELVNTEAIGKYQKYNQIVNSLELSDSLDEHTANYISTVISLAEYSGKNDIYKMWSACPDLYKLISEDLANGDFDNTYLKIGALNAKISKFKNSTDTEVKKFVEAAEELETYFGYYYTRNATMFNACKYQMKKALIDFYWPIINEYDFGNTERAAKVNEIVSKLN